MCMKISGFTIIRNAVQYDFPVVECILSALPLVDEFIVSLGDSSDGTEELVKSIDSPKVKILYSDWDTSTYNKDGMIYAHQTDEALHTCSGDWCLYLQGDEVLHESGIPTIRAACEKYLNNTDVEGFLLKYVHFYGDYDHYIDAMHFAYPKEIRIVRNIPDIHSWRDAQSFRVIENFDKKNYWQEEGARKLNCILLNAYMFHYGWARNPFCMVKKQEEQEKMHSGDAGIQPQKPYFDYGNLSYMPVFKGTHPQVMNDRISKMNWSKYLRFTGKKPNMGKKFGLKYRILNWIEHQILGGRRIGGFKNYKQIGRFKKNSLAEK
ncbi:MAG: hypothetical protein FWF54_09465 [Candidatus Azobacteroides sp.]|nr:hypothetical protein [Candidatus Azobacteroides sp.]